MSNSLVPTSERDVRRIPFIHLGIPPVDHCIYVLRRTVPAPQIPKLMPLLVRFQFSNTQSLWYRAIILTQISTCLRHAPSPGKRLYQAFSSRTSGSRAARESVRTTSSTRRPPLETKDSSLTVSPEDLAPTRHGLFFSSFSGHWQLSDMSETPREGSPCPSESSLERVGMRVS